MTFKIIGSSHPKYLAATDILIGDMAGINYEFLIFNRPINININNLTIQGDENYTGIETYNVSNLEVTNILFENP